MSRVRETLRLHIAAHLGGEEFLVKAVVSLVLLGLISATASATVNVEMVPIGNPGNGPDTSFINGPFGSVGYVYQIGKYEVTAGQYTEFLNAVAKDDPNGLYNSAIGDDGRDPYVYGANIQQSGSPGSFTYSVAPDWANRPVNYVSFWDAARFANWLHNGQPTGLQGPNTTEDGAYTLTPSAMLSNSVLRNPGARFFIPSEDEWYKAAYHDANAGSAANYFFYPTGAAFSQPGRDVTEETNPGNNANYASISFDFLLDSPYFRTEVGEFELSDSPYGTYDQAGNVAEWNETIFLGVDRGRRGGSFELIPGYMRAFAVDYTLPAIELGSVGFRVASIAIPEPSTVLLTIAALAGLSGRRRDAAYVA